jgi:hypothetical protein
MNAVLTIERDIHFNRRGRGGQKELREGEAPVQPTPGRVPRIARLMALAIRFDQLIRDGQVKDYATLARLGRVTRARISQIMNLVQLAPDIVEEILHLPRVERGRDPIHLRQLQSVAMTLDWREQRRLWKRLQQMQG